MTRVRLKGLNRVKVRLRDGREAIYWYAWKGGPRLPGKPGSSEFVAAYHAAVAERRQSAGARETLAGLCALYRSKPEFTNLAPSTQAEWRRWLDRIEAHPIGELSWRLLDDRRVRADLLDWRDEYADRPRTADYGMQVLSRVLSFGVDRGILAVNAAAGVEQIYQSARADQVWTAAEIAAFAAAASSPEVGFIVRLAALTGLRREDLVKLQWSHVGDLAIVLPTGKSRGRKTVVVPLLDDTRELLAQIRAAQLERLAAVGAVAERKGRPPPPEPLTVLSNTRGRPWTPDGAEHQVVKAKAAAKIDKHLHDCRGTFATRLRKAGLTAAEIADVLGWEEARVERLLATYVDRDSIVLDLASRIRRNEGGEKTPK